MNYNLTLEQKYPFPGMHMYLNMTLYLALE